MKKVLFFQTKSLLLPLVVIISPNATLTMRQLMTILNIFLTFNPYFNAHMQYLLEMKLELITTSETTREKYQTKLK